MKDAAAGIEGEYYIERDDGHVETHNLNIYRLPFEMWSEVERLAIKHTKGKVLDIGCGAGRVAIHLQVLGYDVVGIDLSQGAIDASRTLGLREVYVMSASELEFKDEVFDTVILFGNNFGVAGNEKEIVKMLKQLHMYTTPDAIILASSLDPLSSGSPEHSKYHEKNRARNKPPGLIRLRVKYKDHVGDWHHLWLATHDEMKMLAEKGGWQVEEILQIEGDSHYVGILKKS